MGGLWVDYELMTTIPGLFALGEANFSDHGANRLGANSLLQACVDGYFIAPYTIPNYLAGELNTSKIDTLHPAFEDAERSVREQLDKFLQNKGTLSPDYFHKTIGRLLYEKCGLSRSKENLEEAITSIRLLKQSFEKDLLITGDDTLNSELEKAGRIADYIELAELMCHDALQREESCGAHFREEYQTPDGEAVRNDNDFCYVSAWEWKGKEQLPELHKEPLEFESVQLTVRSYK
jgi:succinate dehydrogenase / fumarate reductase flavoprotein subunit